MLVLKWSSGTFHAHQHKEFELAILATRTNKSIMRITFYSHGPELIHNMLSLPVWVWESGCISTHASSDLYVSLNRTCFHPCILWRCLFFAYQAFKDPHTPGHWQLCPLDGVIPTGHSAGPLVGNPTAPSWCQLLLFKGSSSISIHLSWNVLRKLEPNPEPARLTCYKA